jgi:hypothetical protein
MNAIALCLLQAWVQYSTVDSAAMAKEYLHGYSMYAGGVNKVGDKSVETSPLRVWASD